MTTGLQVIVRRYSPGERAQDLTSTVSTVAEVDTLISTLRQDEVDDAYVTHLGRPTEIDQLEGGEVPDHVMYLAVRDAFGYVRYIGPLQGHSEPDAYRPAGDPDSQATHGTNNTDYAAGSGLPLEVFERVITDFLVTRELSASVSWVAES